MDIQLFQIDAFTNQVFGGNPAAVCPLSAWLPDDTLLNIAKENNLAETAFFVKTAPNRYHLRWFTPEIEMDLCGHATLATAYVIFQYFEGNADSVCFDSISGELVVKKRGDYLEMNFPSRPPKPAKLPDIIEKGLNLKPVEVWKSRDYILIYPNEEQIMAIEPDIALFNQINLDPGGVVVTSKGDKVDFVSRFFTPQASIFEDTVTGSAHCSLVPFWANRLGKNKLHAFQLSNRKGELFCQLEGDRVLISGQAVSYLRGVIAI